MHGISIKQNGINWEKANLNVKWGHTYKIFENLPLDKVFIIKRSIDAIRWDACIEYCDTWQVSEGRSISGWTDGNVHFKDVGCIYLTRHLDQMFNKSINGKT